LAFLFFATALDLASSLHVLDRCAMRRREALQEISLTLLLAKQGVLHSADSSGTHLTLRHSRSKALH
jgi:hypothetical protein